MSGKVTIVLHFETSSLEMIEDIQEVVNHIDEYTDATLEIISIEGVDFNKQDSAAQKILDMFKPSAEYPDEPYCPGIVDPNMMNRVIGPGHSGYPIRESKTLGDDMPMVGITISQEETLQGRIAEFPVREQGPAVGSFNPDIEPNIMGGKV